MFSAFNKKDIPQSIIFNFLLSKTFLAILFSCIRVFFGAMAVLFKLSLK